MRAPGTQGLPPPAPERTNTRSELNPPSGANRPERYAGALEALIKEQLASPRRKRREVRNGERSRNTGNTTSRLTAHCLIIDRRVDIPCTLPLF
jgi:hypothetical protein